jgi:hypothetical protein
MNTGHVLLTLLDEGKQQFTCQIKRVIPGEVHFLCSDPVPRDSLAEAEFDEGCRVTGHIVGCLKSGDRYLLSFHINDSDRRQDQRYPLNQPGWLLPSLEPDAPQIAVLIRDISRKGIGLDLPDFLANRTPVVLKTPGCLIFGTIQYCAPSELGFKAGIHVDETFVRGYDNDSQSEDPIRTRLSPGALRIQ